MGMRCEVQRKYDLGSTKTIQKTPGITVQSPALGCEFEGSPTIPSHHWHH